MPLSIGFRNRGAQPDALIIGLGNPGDQFAHTRHNAGFDVLDILASKTSVRITKLRCHALVGVGVFKGKRIALAKPNTYMNLSGRAVVELLATLKPERFCIIYDDIDLQPGHIRVRPSGSAGTHNGMRSIIQAIGRTDFPRIRIGTGRPPIQWELTDWVISRYATKEDRAAAFDAYNRAADAALLFVEQDVESAMRMYNGSGG